MKIGSPSCMHIRWQGLARFSPSHAAAEHPSNAQVKILSTLSDFTHYTEYFLNLLRLVKQRHLIEQKILHGARPGRRPSHDDPLGSRILF